MKKLLVVIMMSIITGCVAKGTESTPSTVGMANPASVYCEQLGGKLEITNTSNGQTGYCILPSGERVEEWDLYRKNHY